MKEVLDKLNDMLETKADYYEPSAIDINNYLDGIMTVFIAKVDSKYPRVDFMWSEEEYTQAPPSTPVVGMAPLIEFYLFLKEHDFEESGRDFKFTLSGYELSSEHPFNHMSPTDAYLIEFIYKTHAIPIGSYEQLTKIVTDHLQREKDKNEKISN